MNKEIFGILMFFFMLASILTLVVGNPLQINPTQTVTINENANENVGFAGFGSQTSCNSPVNNTANSRSDLGGFLGSIQGFLNNVWSGLSQLVTHGLLSFIGFPEATAACALNHGAISVLENTNNNVVFAQVGSSVVPQSVTNNPQLDQAIGIAVIFIGLGLLAGLFGAGLYAGVISVVGIMLSLIYYSLAVINLPNPQTGIPYLTLPAPLMLFFLPIVAIMMIWIILNSLHSV